jgi:hypothetical protein
MMAGECPITGKQCDCEDFCLMPLSKESAAMSDPTQTTTKEAEIDINGYALTEAQSMTIRCALNTFGASLVEDGLGDDEHGRAMTEGYLARIKEIRRFMRHG